MRASVSRSRAGFASFAARSLSSCSRQAPSLKSRQKGSRKGQKRSHVNSLLLIEFSSRISKIGLPNCPLGLKVLSTQ